MTEDRLALDFLGTFESLRMGPTFARGRRDERAGHVRHLTVSGSLVVAQVRGPDDAQAFRARIALRAFGAAEWARVERALVAEARYAADLLGGRMPAGIEEVFAREGLSLVPLALDEVAMDCTCAGWPMPCGHLAATIYALARRFTEDPFGVFTWRGRARDELLLHLRELRSQVAVEAAPDGAAAPGDAGSAGPPGGAGGLGFLGPPGGRNEPEDLGDLAAFWGDDAAAPAVPAELRPGAVNRPDALLDQLDPPPLAHAGRPVVELLRPAYQALPEG